MKRMFVHESVYNDVIPIRRGIPKPPDIPTYMRETYENVR